MVIWKAWRREGGLLVAYSFLLIAETLLIRQPFKGQHFQPELFWSWRVWKTQRNQIITNILMFVPVGVLAGPLWKWRGMLFAVSLSCGIEILQLITSRGLCEFDDVIHNSLGALLGVVLIRILVELQMARRRKK